MHKTGFRKSVFVGLALVACLLLSGGLRAAEGAPVPLPDRYAAHVSVKSLDGLLGALDEFLAAATENTKNAIPPGLIGMVAGMYMPLPSDAWLPEREVHLLFPAERSFGRGLAIVLQVESYNKFLEVLKENGAEISEELPDTEKLGGRAVEITLQGAGHMVALDLGDGRVGIAQDAEDMREALPAGSAWKPWPHFGDAEVVVDISLAKAWEDVDFAEVVEKISADEADLVSKASEGGVNPETVKGFFAALKKYVPVVGGEVVKAKAVSVDLRVNGERIALGFRGTFEPGSLAAESAAHLGKRGNVENPLAKNIEIGAASLAISAGLEDYLPDAGKRLTAVIGDIAEMVFPKRKAAIDKLFATSIAHGSAGKAVASYYEDGRAFNATWLKSSDPAALLGAVNDSAALFNDLLADTVTKEDLGLALKSEKGEVDGHAFVRMYVDLSENSPIREVLEKVSEEKPELARVVAQFENFSIFAGAEGEVVVVVAGDASEEDYAQAIEALKGTEDPMLGTEEAKKVVADLPHREGAIVLVDVAQLFPMLAEKLADAYAGGSEEGRNLYLKALEEAGEDLEDSDELVGVALGAVYGQPLIDVSVSAAAVNNILVNYEIFRGKLDELGNGGESEDESGDQVEEDDDEGNGGSGEGESEKSEDPAKAS